MIDIKKSDCSGCAACASVCPKACIAMKEDSEGFLYPQVNKSECIKCGKCIKVCPALAGDNGDNQEGSEQKMPACFAAVNKDEAVRLESSSGGVFTLLAQKALSQGGTVYGAAMSGDFRSVKHIAVETEQELSALRSSKYLQSEIGDSYRAAKKQLDDGRTVLFTGTPCQIAGLRAFLNKDYNNLICADIICHGVPSPKVWRKYVDFREAAASADVKQMSFRDKENGWKKYEMMFKFSNSKTYAKYHWQDLFMFAFLRNVCLRPSCYSCKFKSVNRQSDITLADFWGVENVVPELDDNKGVSLVLVHTEKGAALFNSLADNLTSKQVEIDKALEKNSSMTKSAPMNKNRQAFFENIDTLPFDRLVKKCAGMSLVSRIAEAAGAMLQKLKKR